MNLSRMLMDRAAAGEPIRVALIGAGKFGSMYLSQARRTPGIHLIAVADLSPANAKRALTNVGWDASLLNAKSLTAAATSGKTFITDDAFALIADPLIDMMIDATGSPSAGIEHVLACCQHGKDIVMVNVEADALAGPYLAYKASQAGITYSLAYGDQPALICELVDWARTSGFEVICAGKGTKYLPSYHQSTPDTVWAHYGITPEAAKLGGMNPQMFNSFLDGTKSAIEMAAVANATGLLPASDGLKFPACGVDDLARVLKPMAIGGQLEHRGQVEVISSLERDGRPVFRDLRWGVFVTFAAHSDYVKRCFQEYGLITDNSGEITSMYKPFHLIGLELGVSVANVAMRGEPTGVAVDWHGDVVATAKSNLKAGTVLDGEGGYTVYGKLVPAQASVALGALPLGLAHKVKLKRNIAAGQIILWSDVSYDRTATAVVFRREMEQFFTSNFLLQ